MKKIIIFLSFCAAVLFVSSQSWAAFDISVSPLNGGNSLRFGSEERYLGVAQEVRFRITSTIGEQYQVFQRMAEPLMNEQGEMLDQNVLLCMSLAGTNMAGTLYSQSEDRIGYSEQLMYTSNGDGVSDSFTFIYSIDYDRIQFSGDFVGRVLFTLRSQGADSTDVILNINVKSAGELEFEVETSTGSNYLRLDSNVEITEAPTIEFDFSENGAGQDIEIYQELMVEPVNEENEIFDIGQILVLAAGGTQGQLSFQDGTPLERSRKKIYSSDQASDSFGLAFILSDENIDLLEFGTYRGQMRYSLEVNGQVDQFVDIACEVNIRPAFEMKIEYPSEGMGFDGLLPGGEPQLRVLEIDVKSNLGKPYVVTHKMADLMTNMKGDQIPQEHFCFSQNLLNKSLGRVHSTSCEPVTASETVVFYSDSEGSSAKFNVIYKLQPFQNMEPGNYKTSIMYSLGQI